MAGLGEPALPSCGAAARPPAAHTGPTFLRRATAVPCPLSLNYPHPLSLAALVTRRVSLVPWAALPVALVACVAMVAQAQSWPFPWPEQRIAEYTARRANAPLVIDGRLDEANSNRCCFSGSVNSYKNNVDWLFYGLYVLIKINYISRYNIHDGFFQGCFYYFSGIAANTLCGTCELFL